MHNNLTLKILAEQLNDTKIEDIAHIACTRSNRIAPFPDLHCDEFPIKHTLPVQIFVATAFTLLILSALIGNSVVMWIILYSKVMRRSFNFFLFNMAFADFLMALLNAGSTWSFNFYYDWWFGDKFCPINHFFGIAPTCVSVFTMMVVSWDRCSAVVDPLKKRQFSSRCTVFIILAIWLLATLISLPVSIPARISKQYFYSIPKKQLNMRQICHNDFEHKLFYDNFLFTIQFVLPVIVLSFMYGRIIFTFRRNAFFANPNVTKAPQHLKAKKRVIKMLGLIVFIFMICWAPYQLYHLFLERLLTDFLLASYMYIFFYWLAMSACVYNPIIYCLFNMRFRTGFRYVFRFIPCVNFNQHQQEHYQMFPDPRQINSGTALKCEYLSSRFNTNTSTFSLSMQSKHKNTASSINSEVLAASHKKSHVPVNRQDSPCAKLLSCPNQTFYNLDDPVQHQ